MDDVFISSQQSLDPSSLPLPPPPLPVPPPRLKPKGQDYEQKIIILEFQFFNIFSSESCKMSYIIVYFAYLLFSGLLQHIAIKQK